jgi:ferric-dicitrate binding protein FerR (iron transport regulator)
MTEAHGLPGEHGSELSQEEHLAGAFEVPVPPAPAGRRSWRKHALAGAAIAAVLAGGALRLVPSGQAAPATGQGAAASTACSAS